MATTRLSVHLQVCLLFGNCRAEFIEKQKATFLLLVSVINKKTSESYINDSKRFYVLSCHAVFLRNYWQGSNDQIVGFFENIDRKAVNFTVTIWSLIEMFQIIIKYSGIIPENFEGGKFSLVTFSVAFPAHCWNVTSLFSYLRQCGIYWIKGVSVYSARRNQIAELLSSNRTKLKVGRHFDL